MPKRTDELQRWHALSIADADSDLLRILKEHEKVRLRGFTFSQNDNLMPLTEELIAKFSPDDVEPLLTPVATFFEQRPILPGFVFCQYIRSKWGPVASKWNPRDVDKSEVWRQAHQDDRCPLVTALHGLKAR